MLEASYVNIPTIALSGSDSPLEFIDIPIPCNNRTTESISMIYWLLAREVQILRGELDQGTTPPNIVRLGLGRLRRPLLLQRDQ